MAYGDFGQADGTEPMMTSEMGMPPNVGATDCPTILGIPLAAVGGAVAAQGSGHYRELGRKTGRGIILGITEPVKDVGCWEPITRAFITPYEQGLRETLTPFVGKKVVYYGAGVFLIGGLLGYWLRGLR